jgi:ZIP family zinc transporter
MQTLSPDVEGGALGVQTLSPVINDDFEGGSLRWWYRFSSGSDLTSKEARRSWRVAVLLFVSLLAHNFPEGFAVAATSVHSPKLGVTTAIAIAFHNIPEGIAIAVPCLAARPDAPWLAFGLASLSGLAEPLGAAVALLVLRGGASGTTAALDIDSVLSFVAGVMVTVALNELFPEARRHSADGKGPLWLGTLAGAVVMLVSDAILDATY